MNTENHSQLTALIWSVADLMRGDFRQSQYGRIILPLTLLRRLECVLECTKKAVFSTAGKCQEVPDAVREQLLLRAAGQPFFNASSLTLGTLSATQTANDLMSYVQSFSQDAREIFEHFEFESFVQQLEANNLLYQVVQEFATIDLSPERLSNFGMGLVFEELIRKFAESSNETAGEHFTPRDVVKLTTSLVLAGQEKKLKSGGIVTVYDPTMGAGGFLAESDKYIQQINYGMSVSLYGQELNPESYAICKADMLIKGLDVRQIKLGNTLSNDQLAGEQFDFMLSNPPFGVEWKKVQKQVTDEHKQKGYDGRFGPGLPRVSDGSLLFLMHLISKMRPKQKGGSRIGIILTGSPMFTGGAGSGESEIRRYLLQHDMVEAIVGLPTDMFYNTGIATYVWILSNNKLTERYGKVQLIDATDRSSRMRKSIGNKHRYIADYDIDKIVDFYLLNQESNESKLLPIEAFGYRRITIDYPLSLNFQVSPNRLIRLESKRSFQKLEISKREKLRQVLNGFDQGKVWLDYNSFVGELKNYLEINGVELNRPVFRDVIEALSEYDPNAELVLDELGALVPDTNLREQIDVPLMEKINQKIFENNGGNAGAWINTEEKDLADKEVGKVGFRINFASYFVADATRGMVKDLNAEWKKFSSFSRCVDSEKSDWDICVSKATGKMPSDDPSKLPSYSSSLIFVKINRDVVSKEYVELFLNGPVWEKGVLKKLNGAGYRLLDESVLMNLELPIPDAETQEEMVSFDNDVSKQIEEIGRLKKDIWVKPYVRKFSNERKDKVSQLIDVLPYPLANLIYHQDNVNGGRDKERYEIILKFLECSAQYFCSVLISMLNDSNCDISTILNNTKKQFDRTGASFGFWVRFIEDLKKSIDFYQATDGASGFRFWRSFLENEGPIFSALPVLSKAKDLRNNKVGHGVYPTSQEAAKTLQISEQLLEDFANHSITFFAQVELARPGSCTWDGVTYRYEMERFSGLYAYPFLRAVVNCKKPLRHSRLHIYLKEYDRFVELPEILTISPAIKEGGIEGFFFLAKKQGNGFLYLCHQQLPMQSRIDDEVKNPFF